MLLRYLLKTLLLPPALSLLLALAAWVCWRRWPRLARGLLAVSLLSLWLLSLPWVGQTLLRGLESGLTPVTAGQIQAAQALVIVGGGRRENAPEFGGDTVNARTLERLRYGASLQRQSGLPILVSGGRVQSVEPVAEAELMAAVLEQELGVEVRWREGDSRTTAENALYSAPLLQAAGVERVLLVTHAWHMPRARWVFEQQGLSVIPAPTGFTGRGRVALLSLIPSAEGLRLSYFALHEWLGLWVYRLSHQSGA